MKKTSIPALAAFVALVLLSLAGCDRFASSETRVKRAEEAISRGDHRAAVVQLMNALQKEPNNAPARLLLAESALWLGDALGAQRELKRLKSPPDARRALLEARAALALGRADDVVQSLSKPAFEFPRGQRELLLGHACLQLRRFADARQWFDAAVAADPSLVEARAGALEARAGAGDRAMAIAGLADLTTAAPDSAAAWMTYGLALVSAGDTAAAIRALARADELGARQLDLTRRVSVLATLVDAQLLQGDLASARASQQTISRIAPTSLVHRYVSSRIAMADNDYATAVSELRKVIDAAPGLVQARLLLSMAFIAQGNLEQASKELNSLLEDEPDNTVARQLLAQLRMRLDDPDGALRMLVPALGAEGGNAEVNAMIDAARSQLGAAQSVSLLEQMLAKDPDNSGLQTQLANAYLQSGAPAKAAALLRGSGDSADARRAAALIGAIAAAEGSPAARAQVDALVAAHPDNARLVQLAATFYARTGDAVAARKALESALAKGADPAAMEFALAQLEWSTGNRAGAEAALARVIERDPHNPAVRMAAGQVALARRDLPVARAHFEAVRAARPDSPDARLLLAQVALGESDGKRADESIAEAVKIAPASAALRNAAGILNLNFGRADRALEQFRAAVGLDAADPVGWFNLARTQRTLGQAGAARESLHRALAAKPHWLPASAALIALDIEARDADAAHARIAELRKVSPKDPGVLVLEGDVHGATQRYADASVSYTAAYDLAPSLAIAVKDARARAAGDVPLPSRLVERWVAAHPRDLEARAVLADGAMRRREFAAAAVHYGVLLHARPKDVITMNNLAWLYHEIGDPRAVELARRAVKLAPQSAAVNDTLGWMLVEDGKASEGLSYLQTAVAAKDVDAEVRFHHAVALARTGAKDEARRHLENLLRTPDFASRGDAEKLLRELSEGSGKPS
jgi:putative PEP-CTERM system TPR-repeat lipoprotein